MIRFPRPVPGPGRPDRLEGLLVGAVTLLGLGLRLFAVDVTGLWWDEFVTLGRAAWPLADLLPSLAFQGPSDVSLDSSPPLFHLLVHASLALFGHNDVAVKLPSLVAGTLTIPAVWLLGRRLFSRTTGLAGAAITAVALFHIHYSREARPYALYLLCALLGLFFLLRAMDSGRRRDWLGFVLANAAMFYASYLASATFFAEGCLVCGRAALTWRHDRAGARRLLGRAALAAALVLLAYLPWLPGHLFQVRTIQADGPTGDRFDSAGFFAVLKAFTAMHDQSGQPWPAILGGLALLGLLRHLRQGRWRAVAALAVWSGSALAMAAALPTQIHVSIRYLVNLFFFYAYLAAGGVEALTALVPRRLPRAAPAVLAVLGGLACGWPMAQALPYYVKRDSPSIKSVLADLALSRDNVDWLLYYRNRHLKIVADWYLPGVFQTAARLPDRAYRRFFFLSPGDLPGKPALPGLVPVRRTFWADIDKGGLVNRAPLPLDAPFAADFTGLGFYADVYRADNMAPDQSYATLGLYDCRRPGRAVFAFAVPPGTRAGQARATVTLDLRPGKAGLPESRATILAGTSVDALSPVATATARDFPPGQSRLDREVVLPAPDPASGLVFLAVELVAGRVDGFLEIAGLRLDPPADLRLPEDAAPLWRRRAAAIAANTHVLPGLGRAGQALGGAALFGFADRPEPDLGLGGREDLDAYVAAYPDDAPVAALADETGAVRARYFDPDLRHPFAGLNAVAGTVLPGFDGPVTARGLVAESPVAGQSARIGPSTLRLPVSGPDGARLLLRDDGTGLLHFSPAFDRPLAELAEGMFLGDALAAVPGEPAVTCAGDAPCFLAYAVAASPDRPEAAPITGFRLAWYPRVLTDNTGHNRVTAAYSTDGATYLPLGELRSVGDFFWYGGAMRMVRDVRLPRPADRLYLRFALSGGGAQLWSAPRTPMTLDVRLAGTGFAGLPLPSGAFTADSPDGPARLLPTLAPPPLGDGLRERR